ncbi:putative CBL-interacting serine/threonine-protein kinase 15 [Paratrimastix pyriformis]|uniref:CBL-interacting serine/threonine-protein kinase 15 n=1 Tax=Paratrimastix pyriformis TaxID=342808 RepID=A0ABQ8UP48_9EUKA|nr:putative CBL-interacting serine/threonine-protein kinase 15 [Paratrimastix pyriformis]
MIFFSGFIATVQNKPHLKPLATPATMPRIRLGNVIGEGGMGKVKIASRDSKLVAVKILKNERIKDRQDFLKELQVMQRISAQGGHKNIIQYLEHYETGREFHLVMELARGGELFDKIEIGAGMPEDRARYFFRQILYGLEFLHQNGIAHRDMKLENCLLSDDETVKVVDFGLSALVLEDGAKPKTLKTDWSALPPPPPCGATHLPDLPGSPQYAAPEVMAGEPRAYDGFRADVWSCGVILFAMLTGCLPWNQATSLCPRFIKYTQGNLTDAPWPRLTSPQLAFLRRMLNLDPASRATPAELLDDPWFGRPAPRPLTSALSESHVVPDIDDEAEQGAGPMMRTESTASAAAIASPLSVAPGSPAAHAVVPAVPCTALDEDDTLPRMGSTASVTCAPVDDEDDDSQIYRGPAPAQTLAQLRRTQPTVRLLLPGPDAAPALSADIQSWATERLGAAPAVLSEERRPNLTAELRYAPLRIQVGQPATGGVVDVRFLRRRAGLFEFHEFVEAFRGRFVPE